MKLIVRFFSSEMVFKQFVEKLTKDQLYQIGVFKDQLYIIYHK